MRKVYAYGFTVSTVGFDTVNLFDAFLIAYGGQDIVTSDGRLHTGDPKVREAAVKALKKLTSAYKDGYVPPSAVDWNDADDNVAFHAKEIVMDFDGSISTELALGKKKELYDDILTLGMPNNNEGEELSSQVSGLGPVIPKGAKNVAVATEFLKYAIEPKVLNEYLKGGLGRSLPPMPSLAESDPFWLDPSDPHRSAYTRQGVLSPTIPFWSAFNPSWTQVGVEHVFNLAESDVIAHGMAPEAAIDKAFKRTEAIFAKYPILQG